MNREAGNAAPGERRHVEVQLIHVKPQPGGQHEYLGSTPMGCMGCKVIVCSALNLNGGANRLGTARSTRSMAPGSEDGPGFQDRAVERPVS